MAPGATLRMEARLCTAGCHGDISGTMDDSTRAFGVREVAERIGLSPGTVRREIKRGALDAIHVGRRVIVPAESIVRFLSHTQGDQR